MIDKILPHEIHYLIEHNLKMACEVSDTEKKLFYTVRAIRLMELNKRREQE